MKNITHFLLVGVLAGTLAISCEQSPYRQSLDAAEQIMDEYPDSAYLRLKDIPDQKLSKREYAEWCLLITQAMDKQYMPHTSDSLIRIAVAYFNRYGNAARRTKAYYYLGRVSQDSGDTSQAQEYYLKALETGKSSGNDRLLALIHSNLGMLYTYQEVYEEALLQMIEAARLFKQLGDTVNSAYVLRDIGRTYHVMDSIDLAINYYELSLADIDSFGRPSVLTELGNLHIDKKLYPQAELYLREALQSVYPDDYMLVCLILGRLFTETGRSDSARIYLNECTNSFRLDTKAGAYYYLGNLSRNEEKWEESTQALFAYIMLRDSIAKQRNTESIRKIQSLFNFKQIEEERNRILQRKIKVERTGFLSFLFLIVTSVTAYIWWRKFQKQKKIKEALIQQYEEQTTDYYQKIRDLQFQLESKADEKERLSMEIKKLELQINQITIIQQKSELKMQMFTQSEIYKKLHQEVEFKFTKEVRKELIATVDEFWPEFRLSIKAFSSKVTEEDILMCCLLKANIKLDNIASWMTIAENSVSMKRIRLAKKLFGTKATVNDLDSFIFERKIPLEA